MQWQMAGIVIFSLWFVTLPLVLWFAVWQQGGLQVQWSILPAAYTGMQFLLAASYMTLDWKAKSKEIRESLKKRMVNEGLHTSELTEETSLLG